jgi:hypothetical protein
MLLQGALYEVAAVSVHRHTLCLQVLFDLQTTMDSASVYWLWKYTLLVQAPVSSRCIIMYWGVWDAHTCAPKKRICSCAPPSTALGWHHTGFWNEAAAPHNSATLHRPAQVLNHCTYAKTSLVSLRPGV